VLKKKVESAHQREVIRRNIYYFNASKTAPHTNALHLFNRLRSTPSEHVQEAIGIITASCEVRHRCLSRSECQLVLSASILLSSQPRRSLRQHSPSRRKKQYAIKRLLLTCIHAVQRSFVSFKAYLQKPAPLSNQK
jgi:hypothetical protein